MAFSLVLFVSTVHAGAPAGAESHIIKYSWASAKIDGTLWGLAQGDVDGDGKRETLLLERRRVRIGTLGDKKFEESFSCGWSGDVDAARIYLMDLDSDGADEVVISAVEGGLPASLALKVDTHSKSCKEIFNRARWSLRVVDLPDEAKTRKALLGQDWSSQQFFSGPIQELRLEGKKLKPVASVAIPRYTTLFQFTPLPPLDDVKRMVRLEGPAAMEVRENKSGGKWSRPWRSPERLGGTSNLIAAEQRVLLDEKSSDYAYFDLPPLTVNLTGQLCLVAPKYDMPVRNIIGRTPYIRGSEVVVFSPDEVLGFVEKGRTQDIPGALVDYIMDIEHPGRLIILVQEDAGAFETARSNTILTFDLNVAN